MFTILHKNVGGRTFDRYYQSWETAKKELLNELAGLKGIGCTVTQHYDYFNAEKGIYIFEYRGKTPRGEGFSLSLLDGHFSD